jgi:PAS domain S-box-containing protein
MTDEAAPFGGLFDEAFVAKLVMANAREYAILMLDEEGVIRSWNSGAEKIFGYTPAEVIGRPFALLFVSSDLAAEAPVHELSVARSQGRAEDSRWHLRKDGQRFWGNGVTMRLEDGASRGFLKILRDETASKLADEQRVLLLNELNHRIKNTLATVQSIADQTMRAGNVDLATRRNLTDRLMALAKAHDILVEESWAGADLRNVVEQALAPHQRPESEAFHLDGPPIRLSPQQALALSLTLHELATNALKYGALSVTAGRIYVAWNVALDGKGRRYMNLLWEERGGPPVRKPEQPGFGTRLISRSFSRESGGKANIDFRREGLRCVIELPLSGPEEIPILDLSREG